MSRGRVESWQYFSVGRHVPKQLKNITMPVGIWGWWFKIDDLRSHFFSEENDGLEVVLGGVLGQENFMFNTTSYRINKGSALSGSHSKI